MWRSAFDVWHPMVLASYFVGTIGLAMFGICPWCVLVSLGGGLLFSLLTVGLRASLSKLRWQLPLLVLICLINPLYSAMGSTLLGRVGPFRIYAESLVYGAVMGALLVSVLLWFEAAARVVGQDEVLELGGDVLPSIALAVSMVMRLIPQLVRRGKRAQSVVRVTVGTGGGPRESMRLLGVLLTWALEDSVERSDSMRARGWGASSRRSSLRMHRVRRRDVMAFVVIGALIAASVVGVRLMLAGWRFYPRMARTTSLWVLLPYALLALLPSAVVIADDLCWKTRG